MEVTSRDALAEARSVAGHHYAPRVLEPAPPTVDQPPWFADDPLAAQGPGRVLSPVEVPGGSTWEWWAGTDVDRRAWVADRWLGCYRRLGEPPPGNAATRTALHTLATSVLTPARHAACGKIGLRWTYGGFGTPFFADDRQVRVQGTHLVDQRPDRLDHIDLTTVTFGRAAALVLGGGPDVSWADDLDLHDPPAPVDPDRPVGVDAAACSFFADWFGFAWAALEAVRHAVPDATRVQLWPEHFDAAFEALPGGARASYGASAGDEHVDEPYLYVSLWAPDQVGDHPLWNAEHFPGAILTCRDLQDVDDQHAHAVEFLHRCCRTIASATGQDLDVAVTA
jgi:hypothetical protein